MVNICYLIPVGSGRGYLNTITLDLSEPTTKILGRSTDSGQEIVDPAIAKNIVYLSRNHIEVKVEDGKVWIKPTARQKKWVHLNGKQVQDGEFVQIKVGDIVCMLGRLSYFSYELREDVMDTTIPKKRARFEEPIPQKPTAISELNTSEIIRLDVDLLSQQSRSPSRVISLISATSTPTADSLSDPVPSPQIPENKVTASIASVLEKNEMVEHVECSICLEVMAFPHNIMPCGDTFCYACIADWSVKKQICPHCQEQFDPKFITHNRVLDNMIGSMMRLRGGEVLADWEAREEQGKEQKKTDVAKPTGKANNLTHKALPLPSSSRTPASVPTAASIPGRSFPAAASQAAITAAVPSRSSPGIDLGLPQNYFGNFIGRFLGGQPRANDGAASQANNPAKPISDAADNAVVDLT